jgi:hypothetical protein
MQVPLQQRLLQFVVMLQHMDLTSFTHQSAASHRKIFTHELVQERVVLALCQVSLSSSHATDTPHSPCMPDKWEFMEYKVH